MRFIKRFIFLLVILGWAFLVYRLISPNAAKSLMYDIQSLFVTHKEPSLSGTLPASWDMIVPITGDVTPISWDLQELSREDELIVSDILQAQDTGDATWTVSSPSVTSSSTSSNTSSATSSSSSRNDWLSSQDYRDFKDLFGQ